MHLGRRLFIHKLLSLLPAGIGEAFRNPNLWSKFSTSRSVATQTDTSFYPNEDVFIGRTPVCFKLDAAQNEPQMVNAVCPLALGPGPHRTVETLHVARLRSGSSNSSKSDVDCCNVSSSPN